MTILLIVTGCTTPAKPVKRKPVDPVVTMARFQEDREKRLVWLRQWQVSGVLKISSEKGNKNLRTEMRGEKAHLAEISVFGPFRQIVTMIFTSLQKIQLVDPKNQQIIEVPATAEGLEYLVGIGLHPKKLFETIIALTGELSQYDPSGHNTWLTQKAERLVLDPETGLIQEYFGKTNKGVGYHVVYRWDNSVGLSGLVRPVSLSTQASRIKTTFLHMPSQVQIMFTPGKTRLKYKAHQWQVPDTPFMDNWFKPFERYPGFSVVHPFGPHL